MAQATTTPDDARRRAWWLALLAPLAILLGAGLTGEAHAALAGASVTSGDTAAEPPLHRDTLAAPASPCAPSVFERRPTERQPSDRDRSGPGADLLRAAAPSPGECAHAIDEPAAGAGASRTPPGASPRGPPRR